MIGEGLSDEGGIDMDEVGEYAGEGEVELNGDAAGATVREEAPDVYATGGGVAAGVTEVRALTAARVVIPPR